MDRARTTNATFVRKATIGGILKNLALMYTLAHLMKFRVFEVGQCT